MQSVDLADHLNARPMRGVPMDAFVEVAEAGKWLCNKYLEAGYHLIGVYPTAQPLKGEGGAIVVKKYVMYVLGRTAEVEHIEPPEREKKAEPEAEG